MRLFILHSIFGDWRCFAGIRLQDEICSITRGKGNRRIDIVNVSLAEKTDKVILEGFEPKLKESLFTQIIEKSSGIWTVWYHKLKAYLDENNSTWPTNDEDEKLYGWFTKQRGDRKKQAFYI